jgi:hypothetical protein
VKRVALEHVAELERKAQELQEMSQALKNLAENCQGDARPDCPIISSLAKNQSTENRRKSKPKRFGKTGVTLHSNHKHIDTND